MSDAVSTITSFLSNQSNSAGDLITKNIDSAKNSVTHVIKKPDNCAYTSSFIGRDKIKYNIVSNDPNKLDIVNCVCIDINNNPTNENAKKLSSFDYNPLPYVNSNLYVCKNK